MVLYLTNICSSSLFPGVFIINKNMPPGWFCLIQIYFHLNKSNAYLFIYLCMFTVSLIFGHI